MKLVEQNSIVLKSTLTLPKTKNEIPTESNVDNKVDYAPSIIRNNALIDLNDKNITNARFIQVNQIAQIDFHLTAKLYVDSSIDEPSLVRNNQDNDFNKHNLTNINNITLNTQAVNDDHVISKAYEDQFHSDTERSRRDLGKNF